MVENCGDCLTEFELQDVYATVGLYLLELEYSYLDTTCPKCSARIRSFIDHPETLVALCSIAFAVDVCLTAPVHIKQAKVDAERWQHEEIVVDEMEQQFREH